MSAPRPLRRADVSLHGADVSLHGADVTLRRADISLRSAHVVADFCYKPLFIRVAGARTSQFPVFIYSTRGDILPVHTVCIGVGRS